MNIDVLNRNPVGPPTNDDDFSEEIQDIGGIQTNTLGAKDDILFVQTNKRLKWFGFKR